MKPTMSDAGNLEDALPIKKTSNVVYIAGGVALAVVVGLILSLSGGKEAAKDAAIEKTQETEDAADAAKGMTKAEAEERAAHIQKTQAALLAADAEETAAEKKRAAAEAKKREEQAQASSPAPAQGASPSQGAAAPKKPAVNKKSLDGLGDDITSALK